MQVPLTGLYKLSVVSWENLFKNQGVLSLVIVSFTLITCLLDQVELLLKGELQSTQVTREQYFQE